MMIVWDITKPGNGKNSHCPVNKVFNLDSIANRAVRSVMFTL